MKVKTFITKSTFLMILRKGFTIWCFHCYGSWKMWSYNSLYREVLKHNHRWWYRNFNDHLLQEKDTLVHIDEINQGSTRKQSG
jgi:hypothetical protein